MCEAVPSLEQSHAVTAPSYKERLQFHRSECRASCSCKLGYIGSDGRVMLTLQFGLIRSRECNARFCIAVQPVTGIQSNRHRLSESPAGLAHNFRRGNSKTIIRNG